MNKFQEFFFSASKWLNKEKELKENLAQSKRHSDRLEVLGEVIKEKLNMSFETLNEQDYKESLVSFSGQTIVGKQILKSRELGESELEKFVDERLVRRTVGFKDRLKKLNIEVFPFGDEKSKAKKKPTFEKSELKMQNKVLNILQDRPLFEVKDIQMYQLSDKTALTSTAGSGEITANMNSSKSKVMHDYFSKVCPSSFSAQKPNNIKLLILEGENVIASAPVKKKTVR